MFVRNAIPSQSSGLIEVDESVKNKLESMGLLPFGKSVGHNHRWVYSLASMIRANISTDVLSECHHKTITS